MQTPTNTRLHHIPTTARRIADSLERAWPESLMEAGCLALFMTSACLFSVFLEHPESPMHKAIPSEFSRRTLMGVAMGSTLLVIIHTPWAKQSGAHMNPGVTLTYRMLGKLDWIRAGCYIFAQVVGGVLGVGFAWTLAGSSLANRQVNFAMTRPGDEGAWVAFLSETAISFVMMATILWASNSQRFSRGTPFLAAALVALFITFESPLSGMSMNAARSFGSAFAAQDFTSLWVYLSAPFLGMTLAGLLHRRRVYCAKIHHHNNTRCSFNCNYGDLHAEQQ